MPDPITASVSEPTPWSLKADITVIREQIRHITGFLAEQFPVEWSGEGTTGEVDRVVEAARKLKAAWLPEHIVKDPLTQAVVDVIVALAAYDEARKAGA